MKNFSLLEQDWRSVPIVAVDIETTGQYAVVDEICEVAAVKTLNGQAIETYQSLVKPTVQMTDFVIGIHGISNAMVAEAPTIAEVLPSLMKFVGEGVVVGHHSPFDVSFLMTDCERQGLSAPSSPVLCSSLLARNIIQGTENHRLQTLVKHLGIDGGQAHRALDDAQACFEVTLHCLKKLEAKTLQEISTAQKYVMWWDDFSFEQRALGNERWGNLLQALKDKRPVEMIYKGGSRRGQKRQVDLKGLVCNPQGAYVVADDGGEKPKRFYFDKISEVEIVHTSTQKPL